jgi:hypothetical protein
MGWLLTTKRAVHLWFFSVLPLLQNTQQLWAILDARMDELASEISADQAKDGLTLAVLALSVAICIFCLQCLRVVWPRGFQGEPNNDIRRCTKWRRIFIAR